jgi:surfeit locus 1 family protein
MLPLLIAMGFWQLDRGNQKQQVMQAFEKNAQGKPEIFTARQIQEHDLQSLLWHKVQLKGQFDNAHQFLLDNQPMGFKMGYYIYTPFRLDESSTYILINRGWVTANPDRKILPEIKLPTEKLSIIGTVKQPQGTGMVLSEDLVEKLPNGLIRIQQVKLEQIGELAGVELQPYIVRLNEASPAGYMRNWPLPGFGKEKHYAYAFQWFAMALAVMIIYIVVNTKKSKKISPENFNP